MPARFAIADARCPGDPQLAGGVRKGHLCGGHRPQLFRPLPRRLQPLELDPVALRQGRGTLARDPQLAGRVCQGIALRPRSANRGAHSAVPSGAGTKAIPLRSAITAARCRESPRLALRRPSGRPRRQAATASPPTRFSYARSPSHPVGRLSLHPLAAEVPPARLRLGESVEDGLRRVAPAGSPLREFLVASHPENARAAAPLAGLAALLRLRAGLANLLSQVLSEPERPRHCGLSKRPIACARARVGAL